MTAQTQSPHDLLPLTPVVFHMLLALADGEKHGYGIMQAVEQETDGAMQIAIGSLYGSLKRMQDAGLIEETDGPPDDDERRRYYRLTGFGSKVLDAEADRLIKAVAVLRAKHLPGSA